MSKPIEITIDVSQIPRDAIKERTFNTKNGPKTVKEVQITVGERREPTTRYTADGKWAITETHWVKLKGKKDDDPIWLGSGVQFEEAGGAQDAAPAPQEAAFDDDIPF